MELSGFVFCIAIWYGRQKETWEGEGCHSLVVRGGKRVSVGIVAYNSGGGNGSPLAEFFFLHFSVKLLHDLTPFCEITPLLWERSVTPWLWERGVSVDWLQEVTNKPMEQKYIGIIL